MEGGGVSTRQKEARGHCPGCWVGSDWWEWGVNPRSMGLIRAKLAFFQANSPARQLTLALNEALRWRHSVMGLSPPSSVGIVKPSFSIYPGQDYLK